MNTAPEGQNPSIRIVVSRRRELHPHPLQSVSELQIDSLIGADEASVFEWRRETHFKRLRSSQLSERQKQNNAAKHEMVDEFRTKENPSQGKEETDMFRVCDAASGYTESLKVPSLRLEQLLRRCTRIRKPISLQQHVVATGFLIASAPVIIIVDLNNILICIFTFLHDFRFSPVEKVQIRAPHVVHRGNSRLMFYQTHSD
ncbi:unnamed protein product [Pleuronectes platessa]|uniref:Uncharacterized protein n=1 Tax=Pleuronectes platessa TaxID=8262 RepID=A0A9N7TMM3_PLEPL|nr:unnamed protein product [Pleuronectes platessa]